MSRIGTRFAVTNPIPPCSSVAEIQACMTAVWIDSDWGWVEVEEIDRAMRIVHQCAPLASAFGGEHVDWTRLSWKGVPAVAGRAWRRRYPAGPASDPDGRMADRVPAQSGLIHATP